MDESEEKREPVVVNIFGVDYRIVGDMEPEYCEELARYVDEKMWELSEGGNIVSSTKVAVLAALNIANELFVEREARAGNIDDLEKRASRLISILDKYI